ncbi:hypothetical protein OK074_6758 [Actinobacteria bacterium OK074]|nr:hypothetical protein OK074_6758 [Actinobacteria bacterium OK074]
MLAATAVTIRVTASPRAKGTQLPMVSSPHEAMHRIIQEDPGLFARAARTLGIPFADPVSSEILSTDVGTTEPLERRVDTLLRIKTADSSEYLLAVEAQRKKDPEKHASWSYYLSYLYTKYKIPPVLVVVCHDRSTAAWAAEHVDIGPPQWNSLTLRPLVLGPDSIPVFTTPEEVSRDIPMTVLSAVLHHQDPEIEAILEALAPAMRELQERDQDTAGRLIELTAQGLAAGSLADFWRKLVAADTSFFVSPLAEGLRDEGREEGREEGEAKGRARDILRLLELRGVAVSDADRDRVASCTDLDLLARWFDRAAVGMTAAEVFSEAAGDEPTV